MSKDLWCCTDGTNQPAAFIEAPELICQCLTRFQILRSWHSTRTHQNIKAVKVQPLYRCVHIYINMMGSHDLLLSIYGYTGNFNAGSP